MTTETVPEPPATAPPLDQGMNDQERARVESDRQLILDAKRKGTGAKLAAYTKLSGPGWLQSAITLGGGSLSGSLYLGVLAGFGLMWLQPLAMIMGIIMLSAIGYVALSTNERPFDAINRHVSPVLGWGWAIATMMANLVWCMPQFALGTAAIQQNLAASMFGDQATNPGALAPTASKLVIVIGLFVAAGIVVWFYDSGGKGIKLFEGVLKAMVGIVVICFFGVVIKMSLSSEGLEWGRILAGFIPDLSLLTQPSREFAEVLAATGTHAEYWKGVIVKDQQQVMITAAATAVGINMTFLLPYSMLRRGWDSDFRGLAIFDLATGLFVPFVLATSCVVIASATQFHAQPAVGFLGETDDSGKAIAPAKNLVGGFTGLVDGRLKAEMGKDESGKDNFGKLTKEQKAEARSALPEADRRIAAMLVKRDAFNLAGSLERLTGRTMSQYVFGIGVLGMAISTIIILMLINGFVFCEMLGLPQRGTPHRIGCYMAGLVGATGPFLWTGDAKLWLAVPTSMFGFMLLPVAYLTFFFLMNSESLLGERMPRGGKRVAWNLLMGIAAGLATFGSLYSIKASAYPRVGFTVFGGFILLTIVVHFLRKPQPAGSGNATA